MYLDLIYYLIRYASIRFPDPTIFWSNIRFRDRSTEIWAVETTLLRCLDTPNTNPADIFENCLDEYTRYYIRSRNPDSRHIYAVATNAIQVVYSELRSQMR